MDIQEILRALKAREITPEEAKKEITKIKTIKEQSSNSFAKLSKKHDVSIQLPNLNSACMDLEQSCTKNKENTPEIESIREEKISSPTDTKEAIAIIGMSGRYPDAGNLEQYWDNLVHAKNSIREIPLSRWDVNQYYDPQPFKKGKIYCRRIGLLENIEYFDPLFFNISPVEAELIDPQHRIFMQEAYKAFEDAGYNSSSLNNKKCGVYMGIMSNEYGMIVNKNYPELTNTTGNSYAIAAARISYFLDLKGPAISIDTACSSSLVATHLACQALLNKEIDMALVGGATLYLTPESYIGMCASGMLSPEGQCKTFDNSADGFVPGEGVGAIVLKRLKDAEADNDNIYGVIIGSGINQDGKTNGITAPSVNGQMELERDIYDKYSIHPESISYTEMHGTGTKLGDPIELEALSTVFKERTHQKKFCAVGSVKSNIGHTSAAAGVASVQKVILCLKYKKLVPTLHFKNPNEHFNFDDSPFYVNTQLRPWEDRKGKLLRACVSSFGFSGTNAHIVIEEYRPRNDMAQTAMLISKDKPVLFVFSAKREQQLKIYAECMKNWIESNEDFNLSDMAYTLQMGREEMDYRLVFIADSREALLIKLKGFIENSHVAGFLTAQVKKSKDGVTIFETDEDAKSLLRTWMKKGKLKNIAELWVKGLNMDWEELYDDIKPRRISLPTYPFACERYWVPAIKAESSCGKAAYITAADIHPLLHRNTFDLSEQRFSSTFTGKEFFLADHIVNSQRILPGVAYLEMAYAALCRIKVGTVKGLSNVVWLRPLEVGENSVEVHIIINERYQYEIQSSDHEGQSRVHCQGELCLNDHEGGREQRLLIEEIKVRCTHRIDNQTLYERIRKFGIEHGPSMQGVCEVWVGKDEALAVLEVPHGREDVGYYTLHPALMDGALQSIAGLMDGSTTNNRSPRLPFSVESMEVLHPIKAQGYAYVKVSDKERFNIEITDKSGLVCLRVYNLALREMRDPFDSFFYVPTWKEAFQTVQTSRETKHVGRRIIIIYHEDSGGLERELAKAHAGDEVVMLKLGSKTVRHSEYHWEIEEKDPESLGRCVEQIEALHTVYHLGGIGDSEVILNDPKSLKRSQERGVISLFRLIKSLSRQGYYLRPLNLKVITNNVHQVIHDGDAIRPYGASLHGLVKSAAKEYPKWSLSCIDISLQDMHEKHLLAEAIIAEQGNPMGNEVAIRKGRRYVRVIEPILLPAVNQSPFKHEGVYLIIGGAGGIGLELSRHLAETVQAKLVLIGRSELKKKQKEKISLIESRGGQVLYLRADITDLESMRKAVKEAKVCFGRINGVIHSAIVLRDKTIENMDEEMFMEALNPKVKGSLVLRAAIESDKLDFMMFFSSVQSFIGAAGQGNYAAGCAFKDAFAQYLNATEPYPVKIINWGYWGSVGVVDSEEYNRRMAAKRISSIFPSEGMEAVRRVMGNRTNQVIPLKADRAVLKQLGVDLAYPLHLYPLEIPSVLDGALSQVRAPEMDSSILEQLPKAMDELERFGSLSLLDAFHRMGVFHRHDEKYEKEELKKKLKIISRYSRLFDALLRILERSGFITLKEKEVFITEDSAIIKVQDAVKEFEKKKNELALIHLELRAHLNLLSTCVKEYPRILTGDIPATDIMFPHTSMELVKGIYKGNLLVDFFNSLVVWSLRAYIQALIPNLGKDDKIKILEVGAGTGGTSAAIFDGIREYRERLQYLYTDISVAFTQYGEKHYGGENPYVEFRVLNIEDDPINQGYGAGEFDVVIGANVLHATKAIRTTLRNIKILLKTNGCLIINELTKNNNFATLTFGLLEGWWLFEDEENRLKGSPLLSPDLWERVLKEEGFERVHIVRQSNSSVQESGQSIVIAESNGIVKQLRSQAIPAERSISEPQRSRHSLSAPHVIVKGSCKPNQDATRSQDEEAQQKTDEEDIRHYAEEKIIECLIYALKIDRRHFDPITPFTEFGVDSILAVEIINQVNEKLGVTLRTTDLFNYSTIGMLSEYIAKEFGEILICKTTTHNKMPAEIRTEELFKTNSESSSIQRETQEGDNYAAASNIKGEGFRDCAQETTRHSSQTTHAEDSDIAIIGISGRFPGANDINEYWMNLKSGKNSIDELKRWKLNTFYDPDPQAPDKSYCKWGGMLEDIDKFDPLFFNISPKEAELMDPQQRLFLEEAWKALEDAGYSDRELEGKRCGVFVGSGAGDYTTILKERDISPDAYAFVGNSQSILAARISYFLNLKGPGIAIDTACSSSLVAIHLACESILSGTCELAITGGVTILTTSSFHIMASRAGMLSPDGQCKVFDHNANGFVPAEGVGAVVLKPLEQALRDGDHIYGVIVGSGINQDGRTNGITAPSGPSQTALECEVYNRYRIHPERITYIDAHGTGTKLGDPIEINALTNAFRKYTDKRHFCAIGSVKTNIGHTNMAAGVASLIKVLLCLKHKEIPSLLNFERVNKHINFEDSPFYVNTELKGWETENGVPRYAAVSSFGFSGTNAHLVVREACEQKMRQRVSSSRSWHLIVLSAKTEESLRRKWKDLIEWLENEEDGHLIEDIAGTLQIGRSHFQIRFATVVSNAGELRKNLRAIIEGREASDYLTGTLDEGQTKLEPSLKLLGKKLIDDLENIGIPEIEYKDKLMTLANLYIKGYDIDWNRIYTNGTWHRIALPTYPFAEERYWIPEQKTPKAVNDGRHHFTKLHPLIDANTSTLEKHEFTVQLRGNEFYLADHIIVGNKVLPAVAYIEMARAAGEIAGKKRVRSIRNLVWMKPLIIEDQPQDVCVSLNLNGKAVDYKISKIEENGRSTLHSQGTIEYDDNENNLSNPNVINIETIRKRCCGLKSREDFYKEFHSKGLKLGPSFQSIQELLIGDTEVVSRIKLPDSLAEGAHEFILHPALMDGALQTVSGLIGNDVRECSETVYVPFSIGEVHIHGHLAKECFAYVTMTPVQSVTDYSVSKFDIWIVNEEGYVLIHLKDLSVRALDNTSRASKEARDEEIISLLEMLSSSKLCADDVEQRIMKGDK